MTAQEVGSLIVEPFERLVRRQRLAEIKKEHDKELTHKPILSKKSDQIAKNRLKADLDRSQDAIAEMNQKDQEAIKKDRINEEAKKTLRDKQKSVTPRIAILYLDGNRR